MSFRNQDPPIELTGVVQANTPKAILFHGDFWDEPQWLPRSAITYLQQGDLNEQSVIQVAGWLAKKNGWTEI